MTRLLLLCFALSLVGCAADNAASVAATINTHCPVMHNPVEEAGGTVGYDGGTVGFCCPGCIEEWDAMSDEEKAAALEDA